MIKRVYSWSCVTYHTEEIIKLFLEKDVVSKYAYIMHDHDNCVPHFHLLLVFKQNVSLHYIEKNLDLIADKHQNTLGEVLADRITMFEYLTHSDKENDKYSYPMTAVCTNAFDYFQGKENIANNTAYQILLDILANRPYRELAKNYGREIILNWNRYNDYANLIRQQEPSKRFVNVDNAVLPFQDEMNLVD